MPAGRTIFIVTKLGSKPNEDITTAKLSAKKLKYLKIPRINKLIEILEIKNIFLFFGEFEEKINRPNV
jgi:hypothetical protein